jgi:hypothetical protein
MAESMALSEFEAKYPGPCADCDERIKPGQLVYFAEDGVAHVDCEEIIPPERPTVTCTECWLIKPCRCDE